VHRVHVLQGGNIVVDGVLASCHSDWFLDDPVQRFAPRLTPLLPAAYQVNTISLAAVYTSILTSHMGSMQVQQLALSCAFHQLAACRFLCKCARCGLCFLQWCSVACSSALRATFLAGRSEAPVHRLHPDRRASS
jgi:hypothetical protein